MTELLLNALIIIMSILCYQVFWLDREKTEVRNETLITLLAAISIILCMTFPFRTLSGGYIYDLRFVPIILCFLYGGFRSFFLVSTIYLAYRYYLGGAGFYPASLQYALLLPTMIALYSLFPHVFKKRKMIAGMLFIFMACLIFVIVLLLHQIHTDLLISYYSLIQLFVVYITINLSTMWVALYLIKGMLENKELRKEIRRSEKWHVLSELTSSIAHEIRNPLTVVHGFIQLFLKNKIQESSREDYLRMMLEELNRAQSIITDYLSFSKPDMEGRERVEVKPLIHQISTIMSPLAQMNHVEIQTSVTLSDSAYLTANPSQIKQCLINIMKNGIESMDNGGILQVNVYEENDYIFIDITDTGIGMTPEEVERIGMPFYSMKEKGTGLGTMVCYNIVRALNGKIKVKSEKNKGTCFSIILPLS